MKFLCDEMLAGLGRWLRIAGFDTLIVPTGMPDTEVIKQVEGCNRYFLTCDAELASRLNNYPALLHLSNSDIESCIKELNNNLKLDWTSHAFERCSVCNSIFQTAPKSKIIANKIDLSKNRQIYYCPRCDKLYWEGSHVKHMRKKLKLFNALN